MAVRILLQPTARRADGPTDAPVDIAGAAEVLWDRVLREYALVLDQHRELLATVEHTELGELTVPHFQPPLGVPPLPESMLSWAEALSRETDELVHQATEFLARSRASTSPVRLGRYSDDASSSFDRKV